MGFMKQILIKANFEKKRAELMLKSDKPDAYVRKTKRNICQNYKN